MKGHWFLFTVDTVLQCPASVDQNSHWGEALPCHRLHMNSSRHSCYLLTIDQVSTDYRPSVDQLLTDTSVKYRQTIAEVSVKYRWTKGYIGRDTSGMTIDSVSIECRPTIVRLSSESRPTIDRISTAISTESRPTIDRLSTECRPTIDRVSTDYRPLYRPIDRSTLPTVNMILYLVYCRNLLTSRRKWYQTSQVIFLS